MSCKSFAEGKSFAIMTRPVGRRGVPDCAQPLRGTTRPLSHRHAVTSYAEATMIAAEYAINGRRLGDDGGHVT